MEKPTIQLFKSKFQNISIFFKWDGQVTLTKIQHLFFSRDFGFFFLLNVLLICTSIPNLYYFWFDFLLLFPSVCVFFSIMKPCTEQTKDPFSYWISLESQSVFTPSFPGFIILLLRENNSMLKIEQKVQFLGCWFSIREKKIQSHSLTYYSNPSSNMILTSKYSIIQLNINLIFFSGLVSRAMCQCMYHICLHSEF